MCVEELEDAERLDFGEAGVEKPDEFPLPHMESVCENTTAADFKQNKFGNFVPIIRSGDWSDIGSRQYMEDTHVCIADLAKNFGHPSADNEAISFYGVFDRHGGKDAAHFVRDNLPRVIVEDADFPLELEKVIRRSFVQTDSQFAETCSHHRALSSGTTALAAMIFGRFAVYHPVPIRNTPSFAFVIYPCDTIKELSDAPSNFPKYAYRLVPFTGLPSYVGETRSFVDVIGGVVGVSNSASIQDVNQNVLTVRRILISQDGRYITGC